MMRDRDPFVADALDRLVAGVERDPDEILRRAKAAVVDLRRYLPGGSTSSGPFSFRARRLLGVDAVCLPAPSRHLERVRLGRHQVRPRDSRPVPKDIPKATGYVKRQARVARRSQRGVAPATSKVAGS